MLQVHYSDCAVYNEPSYRAGPCNCDIVQDAFNEARKYPEADRALAFLWGALFFEKPTDQDIEWAKELMQDAPKGHVTGETNARSYEC